MTDIKDWRECALCEKPKRGKPFTLCDQHNEIYLIKAESRNDEDFKAYNLLIKEGLKKKGYD